MYNCNVLSGNICGQSYCRPDEGITLWNSCGWVNDGGPPPPPPPPPPGGGPGDSCSLETTGACQAGCGPGKRQLIYHCIRPDNSWYKIYEDQDCNDRPCCTTGSWSSCSAPACGACTQTRSNSCSPGGTESRTVTNCPASCMTNFCAGKPACGQAHPVCGTCSNTDGGAGGVPVINSPINAANVLLDASNQATFTWSTAAKAEKYSVQIYPNRPGNPAPVCTDPLVYCNDNITGTSVTRAIPLSIYPSWTFRVRSINDTCGAPIYSAWRAISFNPQKQLTANLYTDDAGDSAPNPTTGKCEAGTNTPAPDTILANLNLSWPGRTPFAATRSANVYTATVPYISSVRANLVRQSSVQCRCPNDCQYETLSNGNFNYNFYVGNNIANPWWQTQNGLAYAGAESGEAIVSRIPDMCGTNSYYTADASSYIGAYIPSNLIDGDNATFWYANQGALSLVYASIDFGQPIQLSGMKIRWYNPGAQYLLRIRGLTYDANGVATAGPMLYTGVYHSPGNNTELTVNFPANAAAYRAYQILINTNSGNAGMYEVTPIYKTACAPVFSLRDSNNTVNSSGIAITGGGDIDVSEPILSRYSNLREDAASSVRAIGSQYRGVREDYDYFYNKYSMGAAPATDFTGALPAGNPSNGRAYYRSGNVTLSGTWNVPANRSLVIFVDGNLTIDRPITVARGGFLAFIVSGEITFANTLGHATPSTAANVAGVFIADQIVLQGGRAGGDLKFVGEGTFVGWSDVQLNRTYADPSTNATEPTEVFRYRPDLLFNTPDRMKQPNIIWQETN